MSLVIVRILCVALLLTCSFTTHSIAEELPHRKGDIPELSSIQFVRQMGCGWNLGNSLECTGGGYSSVNSFEISWGNPATTQEMINTIAEKGFRSVRIPVAWSNLMTANFIINIDLLDRVEEVAGYCLNNDLFVVINIHWDGGWHSLFATDYDYAIRKFTAIWTQIAKRFRDYDDHVIFEALNEVAWTNYFNYYGSIQAVEENPEKAKAGYNLLRTINQTFVDLVRGSGGNNAERFLLIPGYNTDIELTCHEFFQMPEDSASHLMISVHYYTPWDFVGLAEDASYAPMRKTWPTSSKDIINLNYYLGLLQSFIRNGYGVVLGEYSVCDGLEKKDVASIRRWDTMVTKTALQFGYCPMFWDNGYILFNRGDLSFYDEILAKELSDIANSKE